MRRLVVPVALVAAGVGFAIMVASTPFTTFYVPELARQGLGAFEVYYGLQLVGALTAIAGLFVASWQLHRIPRGMAAGGAVLVIAVVALVSWSLFAAVTWILATN